METGKQKQLIGVEPAGSVSYRFMIAQVVLRALIVLSTISAICLMATSNESITVLMVTFSAKYSYSSAFRFLFGVDAAVCGLSLLSRIGAYALHHIKSNPNNWFFVFLHDLIVMVLLISACGGATSIGYVGVKGQNATGWFKICDRVGIFCTRNGVSIGLSYVAFFCLFALTVMSVYKLKKSVT